MPGKNMEFEVNNENENSKKTFTIIFISFSLLAGFFLNNIISQEKENTAADVQAILSRKIKTMPVLWRQLLLSKRATVLAPASVTIPEESTLTSISEQTTEELAQFLDSTMKNIDGNNLSTIEKNIEVADTIIARVPDSYSAYKAKLISLLVKEAKFKVEVEDDEINSLLEIMATFDVASSAQAIKEAILITGTGNEILQLQEKLADLAIEEEQLALEYAALDINSPEARLLDAEQAKLLADEQELFEKILALEHNNADEPLSGNGLNEDLVHIPFLRALAKNDFDEVLRIAQDFTDQFPNSPIGYYYLIKTLSILGRDTEALSVIINSPLSKDSLFKIQENLDNFSDKDPQLYWQMLRF
ncbi:MAG: hypothetical protein A2X86_13810 [Bdellovibrionales bacterium GWA2_49_15]|nr:MAG: hypothetical protein A2X86_13810 [Bdellovibrionales bacterium GWA2_49_15]HAZ13603.1 hypothetical protein [Bdellovibrionales bacterium]